MSKFKIVLELALMHAKRRLAKS